MFFLTGSFGTSQSEQYSVEVSGTGCGTFPGAATASPASASLTLRATVPNQLPVPPGFQPQGISGLVTTAGNTVSVGSVAAGAQPRAAYLVRRSESWRAPVPRPRAQLPLVTTTRSTRHRTRARNRAASRRTPRPAPPRHHRQTQLRHQHPLRTTQGKGGRISAMARVDVDLETYFDPHLQSHRGLKRFYLAEQRVQSSLIVLTVNEEVVNLVDVLGCSPAQDVEDIDEKPRPRSSIQSRQPAQVVREAKIEVERVRPRFRAGAGGSANWAQRRYCQVEGATADLTPRYG